MNNDVILKIERVVLSAILFTPDKYDDIADFLHADDFLDPRHACMFRCIESLRRNNKAVSTELLYIEMSKSIKIDLDYIVLIASESPIANIDSYVEQIKNASINRTLFELASFIRDNTQNEGAQAKDTLEEIERKIYAISLQDSKSDFKSGQEIIISTLELIKDNIAKHEQGALKGIDTGFSGLNDATTGFNGGELIVIGARPSMGKSALMLSMSLKMLLSGKGVAIFSLEMPSEHLMIRMLSAKGRVPLQNLRTGQLDDKELEKLTLTSNELCQKANFYIDDSTGGLSISSLRSKMRKLVMKDPNVSILMIDYLQLMDGLNGGDVNSRNAIVAEITRGLKKLARELNIPIVALSQLNRMLENRPDKRPILADLRESGAIEQDADVILFLYRDEVYKERESKQEAKEKQKKGVPKEKIEIYKAKPIEDVELILAKNRNGETKTIHIKYNKQFTLFEDVNEQRDIELSQQVGASIKLDNVHNKPTDIDLGEFPILD